MHEYDATLQGVQQYLDRPEALNGFLFSVAEGDDLNVIIGRNDQSPHSLWLDQLLGIQLMAIAQSHEMDPRELADMAVEFALEHMDA